jgi:hypothetical protein
MPSDDRDQQFDRALARHLRSASPDAACPDAEILAAYHERSLSLEEMAHWKAHMTSCSRCQETLALLEQTDSVAANDWEKEVVPAALQASRSLSAGKEDIEEEKPSTETHAASAAPAPVKIRSVSKGAAQTRRRVPWGIVIPTGVLAASLLVWVAVHERPRYSANGKASVQVAENREARPPVSSVAPQSGKVDLRDEGSASLQSKNLAEHKPPTALTSPALHAQAPSSIPSAVPAPAAKEFGAPEQDKLAQLDAGKSAVSSGARTTSGFVSGKRAAAAAPAAAGGPLVANQMQNQMQNQNVTQNASQAPNPAANQVTDQAANQPLAEEKKDAQRSQKQQSEIVTVAASTETVEVTSAPPAPTAGALSRSSLNGRAVNSLMLMDRNIIVSPNKKLAWRVGPGGKIERSTDAGKTWRTQESGVTADLLSGSAPADKVCWIAGKAGTLLLTTDGGKHWKQVASPISDDLGAVHALDAQHASISDVPNSKSFETSDGGLTWKLVANQ